MLLEVETTQGTKTEIVYTSNEIPLDFKSLSTVRKKKGKSYYNYYNISSAFDIESTTIENVSRETPPQAFMYHWQFCLKDAVCFGRTWEDFVAFLNRLRKELHLNTYNRLVVYVHNLSYEFQFIKDFIRIDDMFSKDKRKPIYILSEGIEFRCSYFLSNMTLAKFCENSELCTHYKLDDTYDYKKLRTPATPMTREELAYCYNDVRGLCECIDTLLLEDTIATIPLTSTGYVRRDFRNAMQTKTIRKLIEKTALSYDEYILARKIFRGGDTHAFRKKSGKTISNAYSVDEVSAYPAVLMCDYFPMGKFTKVTLDTMDKLSKYCSEYCVMMTIELFEPVIKPNVTMPYIDIAHCDRYSGILNDNGRVISANYLMLSCTEIDFEIIKNEYYFDSIKIETAYYAARGELPEEFKNVLMSYYRAKTELKDVQWREYEYIKSKNKLNSSYGMTVTDILNATVEYIEELREWNKEPLTPEKATAELERHYKSRNTFLCYQWGVWCTAHARRRLRAGIYIAGNDIIYIDTDSVKFENAAHIAEFEKLNETIRADALTHGAVAYRDGKEYVLGVFDYEGHMYHFKTLGAKKYCYDDKKGFHTTVAGMNKKLGAKAVEKRAEEHNKNVFDAFEIGAEFHNVGRTTSYYNEAPVHKITVNGDTFYTASNIAIVDTTYTLGITDEYYELIYKNFEKNVDK